MKHYKCPVCKEPSCGDDYHTKTTYAGPERSTGDRMKIILLQIYDMITYDNLQAHEIKGLIAASVDEHIEEEDELEA